MKLWEVREKLNEIEKTYGDAIEVAVLPRDKDGDDEHRIVTSVRVSSEMFCPTQRVVLS